MQSAHGPMKKMYFEGHVRCPVDFVQMFPHGKISGHFSVKMPSFTSNTLRRLRRSIDAMAFKGQFTVLVLWLIAQAGPYPDCCDL